MKKPVIAITEGDPSGIGPEVAVKSFLAKSIFDVCTPFIIGSEAVIKNALALCCPHLKLRLIDDPRSIENDAQSVPLLNIENEADFPIGARFPVGKVDAASGLAAFIAVKKSAALAGEGKVDAVVTSPINKESLKAAGVPYIGHTEIYAALSGVGAENALTLFETRRALRVFFLSRHVSLRNACNLVTKEKVMSYISKCCDALQTLGIKDGTLALAALNPHGGESGLFGTEDAEHIAPAVREMSARGYKVAGPIGADSVFHQAFCGKYAAVLSLYHDQGHIACKTLDFERTISITLGLPYLRVSVDHGTAFDIAGQNKASAVSTIEAIYAAAAYSGNA